MHIAVFVVFATAFLLSILGFIGSAYTDKVSEGSMTGLGAFTILTAIATLACGRIG